MNSADALTDAMSTLELKKNVETSPAGQKFIDITNHRLSQLPKGSPSKSKRKTASVRFGDESGALVTFLTPIRASKDVKQG